MRHGITEYNKKGCFLGDTDAPLSKESHDSLVQMAEKIKSYNPDIVISSPAQRARSTAHYITNLKSIEIIDNLKELSFGDWEGMTSKEVNTNEKYIEDLKSWKNRNVDSNVRPTGGESLGELETRVKNVLNVLFEKCNGKTRLELQI